jgi:hypothetical protein
VHELKQFKMVKFLPEPCRENRMQFGNVDRRGFVSEAAVLVLPGVQVILRLLTGSVATGRVTHAGQVKG